MEQTDIPRSEITKMQWFAVRAKRDQLIAETDWTQIADAPLTQEQVDEFKVYRQALRDIPQNVGNPDDVVWPTKPTI
ncbi:TPA: phage tail assembly chaperone [Vibrio parahaemolyticus]|nr:phage tail assembly chaperone [Vibrio parahaemolyticus]